MLLYSSNSMKSYAAGIYDFLFLESIIITLSETEHFGLASLFKWVIIAKIKTKSNAPVHGEFWIRSSSAHIRRLGNRLNFNENAIASNKSKTARCMEYLCEVRVYRLTELRKKNWIANNLEKSKMYSQACENYENGRGGSEIKTIFLHLFRLHFFWLYFHWKCCGYAKVYHCNRYLDASLKRDSNTWFPFSLSIDFIRVNAW